MEAYVRMVFPKAARRAAPLSRRRAAVLVAPPPSRSLRRSPAEVSRLCGWVRRRGRPACGPGWGCARPASPRALPARSCAAPGGQNGGVEQSSEARGAGGPARPGAARGTDIAPSRPVASPRPGPGALTISRFPPPGRRRRDFVAGSGPARPRLRKPRPARPGTQGVCLRRGRGCCGPSSTRRLKTTGTSGGSWAIAVRVLLRASTPSTVYSTHKPLRGRYSSLTCSSRVSSAPFTGVSGTVLVVTGRHSRFEHLFPMSELNFPLQKSHYYKSEYLCLKMAILLCFEISPYRVTLNSSILLKV
ncbi:translation initiation factor IF-2-like [Ursus arctos]|uniref:translation initiation factor IF-2-like n=1 Tax=Ursus arctos TaxID=9644 RepID=UPI002017E6DB|nr:translation initiation factor IF-2-like [Ursus arctos]